MKTTTLCAVGLAAGIGLAAATQYPVMETLGYLPEEGNVAAVDTLDEGEPTTALSASSPEREEPNSVEDVNPSDSMASSKMAEPMTEADNGSAMEKEKSKRNVANMKSRKTKSSRKITSLFDEFEPGIFAHNGYDLPYRLRRPEQNGANTQASSLVVFLHGAGERGDDNKAQMTHGSRELAAWLDKQNENALILFPQCPKGEQWAAHKWSETSHSMHEEPTKSMAALLALLDNIIKTESIDESRIYATGVSMGGFGVFDLVARRPNLFAAAAPLCGGADCKPSSLKKLSTTPLYIVHGSVDPVVDVSNSRKVVAGLKKLGVEPVYIEPPGVWHDCWTETYGDDAVFEWMFAKTRSANVSSQTASSVRRIPNTGAENNSAKSPKTKVALETKSASKKEESATPPAIAKRPETQSKKRSGKSEANNQGMKSQKVVVAKPPIKDVPEAKTSEFNDNELSGKWIVTRAIHAGSPIPMSKLQSMTIEFGKDQIIIQQGSKREVGLLETRNSNSIGETSFAELKITSSKRDKGEIRGFYYFDADELTMIWGAPGADRPDPTDREQLAKARILTLQAAE